VALAGALNQLERSLASDIGLIDTIDIDTEGTTVADQGRSTRIAVGKYVLPQLYLKYGQGFSVAERDVFLEYQIHRHLLFTSEVRQRVREAAAAETEYNCDLKFRVEY
jgi:autotransporter translocation and assembly factor TamB